MPAVLGHVPSPELSSLQGLFVTDDGKVFVADENWWKMWAIHPPDTACSEVLKCPYVPSTVLVHNQSLYVALCDDDEDTDGVYEYSMPPEFQV